jgi:hypothetical protein
VSGIIELLITITNIKEEKASKLFGLRITKMPELRPESLPQEF